MWRDEVEVLIEGEDGTYAVPPKAAGDGLQLEREITKQFDHYENLVPLVPRHETNSLVVRLMAQIEEDIRAQAPRDAQIERHMKLLNLGEAEPDDYEDEEAETAGHSLLATSLIELENDAKNETLPIGGPCKAEPAFSLSAIPEEAREEMRERVDAATERVEAFFNHYLTRSVRNWRRHHSRMLRDWALVGDGFKKVSTDPTRKAPILSEKVNVEDLILAHDSSLFEGRVTHRYWLRRSEILRRVETGEYDRDAYVPMYGHRAEREGAAAERARISGVTVAVDEIDPEFLVYECHVDLAVDFDPHPRGLPRPYIVTILAEHQEMLAMVRNWAPEDMFEGRRSHFAHFAFMEGFGRNNLGLGGLLANGTEELRTATREAYRAARLANLASGFMADDVSIRDGNTKFKMGEFIPVDASRSSDNDVRKAFAALPFKGVDAGLLEVSQRAEERYERLSLTTRKLSELAQAQTPVGTMLAAIEEASKPRKAVFAELYYGMVDEFAMIRRAFLDFYGDGPVTIAPGISLHAGDLSLVEIVPAMRPGSTTRLERVLRAEAGLRLAQENPEHHDVRAAIEEYHRAMGTVGDELERIMPEPEEAQPHDAVTEHTMALRGEPLRAGLHQDHQSHVAAHLESIQMLEPQAVNDSVAKAVGALMAHVAEHMGLDLATQVAAELGIPIEQLEQGIPPEIEVRIAPQIAQAMAVVRERLAGEPEEPLPIRLERIKAEGRLALEAERGRQKMAEAQIDMQEKMAIEAIRRELARQKMRNDAEISAADNQMAYDIAKLRLVGQIIPRPATQISGPTHNTQPGRGMNPGRGLSS